MLFIDQIASSEAEAVILASQKMRLDKEDVEVKSVTEVQGGVKVRVEATRSRGEEALAILVCILQRVGIKTEFFFIESNDRILINVKGDHLGLVIGKAGSTLEALELLVTAMHNRGFTCYKPVVINPGGYRENKKKALKTLVRRACEAASNGERVSLPVMRQRDRKQVHQIIKEFPGFRSRSIGEGSERCVHIFLACEEDIDSELDIGEAQFIPPESSFDRDGKIDGLASTQ